MKKRLLPLAVILLLALAVPAAFAEVELGMSWTPIPITDLSGTNTVASITGFHVAYAWGILYGSWDALAMPAALISNMTGYFDEYNQVYVSGVWAPGFVNLYDVGLRLMLRPFVVYTELGMNSLYVYKGLAGGSIGANLRLGAGLVFGSWGASLSGTAVFNNFATLGDALKKLAAESTRTAGIQAITSGLIPSLNVTLYF